MWQEENMWLHYVKNIIAADVPSAVFLATYLREINFSKIFIGTLEVLDLNKYKVVKKKNKIRAYLNERNTVPFVFVICNN